MEFMGDNYDILRGMPPTAFFFNCYFGRGRRRGVPKNWKNPPMQPQTGLFFSFKLQYNFEKKE